MDAFLARGANVYVSWEDDGDCGMKDGGGCDGEIFSYPAMHRPWGGCLYHIDVTYEGLRLFFTCYQNEDDILSRSFSVYAKGKELSENYVNTIIPEIFEWI